VSERHGPPPANVDPERVGFDERGLVPAIVQDAATGAVLMLAYMDREALDATLRTREVHFHSRSRGRLWKKGETSGNVLHIVNIALDCDADALLVKAHPAGPTCHTGAATCFSPQSDMDLGRFLTELAATLIERKRDLPAGSYSAELFRGGTEAIATKLVALGHEVRMGSRSADNENAAKWTGEAGPDASHGTFADAAGFGELLFNCTAGLASLDVLRAAAPRISSGRL